MPFEPTEEQRRAGLEHVHYEISQLAWLYHLRSVPLGQLLKNAIIETTVIHLSILRDFFVRTSRERTQDDLLAEDYGFAADSVSVDRDTIERRNKEVAHLTYTRTSKTPETRGWQFDGLVPPVLRRAQEFVTHILGSKYIDSPAEQEKWRELGNRLDGLLSIRIHVGETGTAAATMLEMSFPPQSVNAAQHGKPALKPEFSWPVEKFIASLETGDNLAQLVASRRSGVGHDVRENLLEELCEAAVVATFGREAVSLRRQVKTVLELREAPFPGAAQPDIAVGHGGLVHFCEVKSNRIDYPRFDNVFDSKPFIGFLELVGDGGAVPWEVEQDLIKLDRYKSLAANVGSCLFLMIDGYQGSGVSWSQVFQDRALFLDTMRTNYVRSIADRLLTATRVIPIQSTDSTASMILIEVHPSPR